MKVHPVKAGSFSNAPFKFNKKGKLTNKESNEIIRTSSNIFDWFRKGSLRNPNSHNTNHGRGGSEENMERVVAVVRHSVDPHHHTDVHPPLAIQIILTEKGVDLVCPIVWHITEGRNELEKADMRKPASTELNMVSEVPIRTDMEKVQECE